ncbi:dihydropteroate synthase [Sorangium cellulosum]|uniref:dihydropteroate synthase n=2 Tax=Sorangium cellulosum TaxID=56 RepID=A0A2L0F788_SORCE|nr:dihydropteroate synthase [Sorangium cellulosum]
MGVLNRTPDSFSDGGRFAEEGAALAQIDAMLSEGADMIDIGAESTRPGARPVPDDEQIARIGGSVRDAVRRGAVVSIDTTSPAVAARALDDGAAVVNTISLDSAAELGALCARRGASLVLMHSRGPMSAMAGFSAYPDDAYGDVVADVAREWSAAAERALAAGLPRGELVLDPGLGFAKNARQSLELCARLDELCALGFPVLVGPSRKSFVARAAAAEAAARGERAGAAPASPEPAPPEARLGGTIAAALACAARGAAAVRVHDVGAVRQALDVMRAIERAGPAPLPSSDDRRRAGAPHAQGARGDD